MKTLQESMREAENKKRTLEEDVDALREECAKLKAAGRLHDSLSQLRLLYLKLSHCLFKQLAVSVWNEFPFGDCLCLHYEGLMQLFALRACVLGSWSLVSLSGSRSVGEIFGGVRPSSILPSHSQFCLTWKNLGC
jgi:hypothetical protein